MALPEFMSIVVRALVSITIEPRYVIHRSTKRIDLTFDLISCDKHFLYVVLKEKIVYYLFRKIFATS